MDYNDLSPALYAGYGVIDPFDLRWINEAGILPKSLRSTTEEEKIIAKRLIDAYGAATGHIHLWTKNLSAIVESEDPVGFMVQIIKDDEEETLRQNEEDDNETKRLNALWDNVSEENKALFLKIHEWESSNWADAFTSEDSPYLNRQEVRQEYTDVYGWLSLNNCSY